MTRSNSQLSRLETGSEPASLTEIACIALLDPQKRGREWLAFGVWETRKSPAPPLAASVEGDIEAIRAIVAAEAQKTKRVARAGRNGRASDSSAQSLAPEVPTSKRKGRR